MNISHQQEKFSIAFVEAIASVAGISTAVPVPDDDSVDLTLSRKTGRRPKIDVQVKCCSNPSITGDGKIISYPLKKKNHNDLALVDLCIPRILIVVTVPGLTPSDWLIEGPESLTLKKSAFWTSLKGNPPTTQARITVQVPIDNQLTCSQLNLLLDKVEADEELS